MDLDSESDEDQWGSGSGKNSLKNSDKDSNKDSGNKAVRRDSIRRKITEKLKSKEEGRESTSPVPPSSQKDTISSRSKDTPATSTSTVTNSATYFSPTKPTTTTNNTTNNTTTTTSDNIPHILTNSSESNTLPTQEPHNHDYSTYDQDNVSGLPAPHSAAAMNNIERLKGFAHKQVNLLQSLDQAQRQPVSVHRTLLYYTCSILRFSTWCVMPLL